jgi:hypothetical protein
MRKMAELRYGNPIDLRKLSTETGIPAQIVAELLGVVPQQRLGRVLDFRPKAR